ncbi:MAG: hypothetical protein KA104_02870 [Candidatus Pacebacteria bacterium]|nr:hypothetical protein [Candidatus Paceibacterota bacterium]
MKHFSKRTLILTAGALILIAIAGTVIYVSTRPYVPTTQEQVRGVVYGFGDELSQVQLLEKSATTTADMDKHYSLYIHPDLLTKWKEAPLTAPGRTAASPWPDHIDIRTVTLNENGTYTVEATVVDKANGISSTTPAHETPVVITLTQGPDGWQITSYEEITS